MAKEIGMDGIVVRIHAGRRLGHARTAFCACSRSGADRAGEFELATSFRFGGTPYDLAESGLRLYAKEVLPVLKTWKAATAKSAPVRAAE